MNPIFEYSNYREYLADYYFSKKVADKKFSHRQFLQNAGMKGPNFLKNVMDGKKNLSPNSVRKFARALGLSKREHMYFENLVFFNQAKTAARKKLFLHKLSGFAVRSKVQSIQKNQFEYFSKWYNIAVREYIHCHRFKDDYRSLAASIFPNITERQARQAVALLKKLNMIREGKDGYVILTDPLITTGPEISDIGAHEYHKNMLEIGKKAVDSFSSSERYLRSITGSFSQETYEEIKLVIDQSRMSILELIASDQGKKKVYQVGMQLYPLSPPQKRRKRS